jgi:amino acid transporter
MADPSAPTLCRGALGTGDIVFFVVSAAAPLMIMAGIAPFALLVGGLGVPAAYLFAGAVLTVFAVGFTTMSRYVASGGAFYAYVTKGLGKPAGIAAGLVALVSYNALQIGMYGLLGVSAHETAKALWGIDIPWPVIALAGVALVWYMGFRSVDFGAKVLGVLLAAESGILLLLAIAILVQGGAHGLAVDSFTPAHLFTGGTGTVLALAFGAYIGFESTAIYRSEAREPRRTVPRATYISVGFLALFYAFITWTIIQAYGADYVLAAAAEDPIGLFFTAAEMYLGSWASTAMHLLIITSIIATLLAFHNAITRYTLAISNDGMLPSALGRVHPRTRSPYVAGIAQTVLAAVVVLGFALAGADPYLHLLIWVNSPGVLGIVLLQAAVAIAVPVFFRRIDHTEGAWRTLVAPVLSAAGMITALYLMVKYIEVVTGASQTVNLVLILTVPAVCVAGLAWALWLRRSKPEVYARVAADEAEAPASAKEAVYALAG